MSAIAGLLSPDGPHQLATQLAAMARSLAFRVADGWDLWHQGPIGLAQGTTCTTPWSRPDAAIALDTKAGLALTADATLYNRRELLSILASSGGGQELITDGDLLLAAWRHWGDSCVQHLVGDYAFSLWDEREKTLFCARDHFGARPFLYSHSGGERFAFASEIKAILQLSWVDQGLDDYRIADYLLDIAEDRSRTFYSSIRRLPPAHTLVLREGHLRISRYWEPNPFSECYFACDQEYAEAFREKFDRAVSRRLTATRGVGLMLSGGVDSSAVAAVAQPLLRAMVQAPLRSFSLRYQDSPNGDERAFCEDVVKHCGLVATTVIADSSSFFCQSDQLFDLFGEPYDNPQYPIGLSLWEQVRLAGLRVVLDGVDGDTVVSYHHSYLVELASSLRWWTLLQESVGLSHRMFDDGISAFSILWQRGLRPTLSPVEYWLRRALGRPRMLREGDLQIVDPELAARVGLHDRLVSLYDEAHRRRSHRAFHCYELSHGVMASSLESLNRMGAAMGIEARHPFFDRDLVEFCVALPRVQKIRHGWTRSIVRRSLADVLPASILWRGSKWGPNEWFAKVLRERDGHLLHQLFEAGAQELDGFVDPRNARTVVRRYLALGDEDDAFQCALLAILTLWLRGR